MQLKTILNRVHKFKSFVCGEMRMIEKEECLELEIQIRPRANSRPLCSVCGKPAPGYDRLGPRRFQFISFWGVLVFFVYAMRRVNCPRCGVRVERVEWSDGKSSLTTTYVWFLARWARRLSWSEVAEAFHTSWHHVAAAVEMAVEWGRTRMSLDGITAIGVDEIAWRKGHIYATLVYQINEGCKRLLYVGESRTVRSLLGFFRWLGKARSEKIEFVCSDMWKAYLKVIAKKIPLAIHILDRFHIMVHFGKAIDRVRSAEAREMKSKGLEPVLTGSRWCLLKRARNLTRRQATKLKELLQFNLRTVRAYLLREEFQKFWHYVSPHWAGVFLDQWCAAAMRSRIEPFKEVARMLRRHRPLILNYFHARREFSCGVVEGFNNKVKLTTRKAYGYSSFKTLQLSLYHTLGNLPEPKSTHEFF